MSRSRARGEQCTILHAANRRIYGQWTSSIPSRFVGELPADHIEEESTMGGGQSMWRANWSATGDPFAHVGSGAGRGPGWQRATGSAVAESGGSGRNALFTPGLTSAADRRPGRPDRARTSGLYAPKENRGSAVSLGNKGRSDVALGQRVFHEKFGYGAIVEIEGNKLEIDFEHAGRKRVMDSFVKVGKLNHKDD